MNDYINAQLRCYGSPGCFDSGLQLVCIGLVSFIFLLTISHTFSMRFRSGEFKHSNPMVIKPGFGIFGSVGSCQVLLEN